MNHGADSNKSNAKAFYDLMFNGSITDLAESMEKDGTCQGVASLAFVQPCIRTPT